MHNVTLPVTKAQNIGLSASHSNELFIDTY